MTFVINKEERQSRLIDWRLTLTSLWRITCRGEVCLYDLGQDWGREATSFTSCNTICIFCPPISLSPFNPTDRAVVCLHFGRLHLSQFYPLKEFLWKSPDFCGGKLNAIFLLREKCNLLIKLLSLNRGEGSNQ